MRRIFTFVLFFSTLLFSGSLLAQLPYNSCQNILVGTSTTAPTGGVVTTTVSTINTFSTATPGYPEAPLNPGWYTGYPYANNAVINTVGGQNYIGTPGLNSGAGNAKYRLYTQNYIADATIQTLDFWVGLTSTKTSGTALSVNFSDINFYYNSVSGVPWTVHICNTAATNTFSIPNSGTLYFHFQANLSTTPIPASTVFRISFDFTQANATNSSDYLYMSLFSVASTNVRTSPLVVLPVRFEKITVSKAGEGAQLTWNVGEEQNVSGYDVEKSTDSRSFTKIGFVAASGQSTYNFNDPRTGSVNLYRIKSIDIDGKFQYSMVVIFNGDKGSVVVKAFMSDKNTLTVQHDAAQAGSRISVVSMDGRVVKQQLPTAGAQQTTVDLSNAQTGLYIIRYDNGQGGSQSIKVAK